MQTRNPILIAAAVLALPAAAAAQCEWAPLGTGEPGSGPDSNVFGTTDFEGDLYISGGFSAAGGVADTQGIARWNGAEWESIGGGVDGVIRSTAVIDDALWVGGTFETAGGVPGTNRVVRWDGESWLPLPSLTDDRDIFAIAEFDGAVYVGGRFNRFDPGPKNIARWDGVAWSAVGDLVADRDDRFGALIVFDDGSGPALYAGGHIDQLLGGEGVAKWDGETWAPVVQTGGGPAGRVWELEVFEDSLYIAGSFTDADGQPSTSGIARWDGESWTSVGGGVTFDSAGVRAMEVIDDGTGPALFVGGDLTSAGSLPVNNIAKWDGEGWAPLGDGVNDIVLDIATLGGDIYAGGDFTMAGGMPAERIARWACDTACYADCDASGGLDFFDFLCYQNLFAAGDPAADCDESGDLDFFDFLCFQDAFAAGCP